MTLLFAFFCQRCGGPFHAPHIAVECPPCMYAVVPQRVVLGFAQRTRLVKAVAV